MGEFRGNLVTVKTPNPENTGSKTQFECPLCVEVFSQFSQLTEHLLSMHPRRERIMNLILERYGITVSTFGSKSSYLATTNCDSNIFGVFRRATQKVLQ